MAAASMVLAVGCTTADKDAAPPSASPSTSAFDSPGDSRPAPSSFPGGSGKPSSPHCCWRAAGVAVAAGLFNARELVTDDEDKGSSHGSGNAEGDLHQIHQA
jgi:hypothetical protein